MTKTMLVCTSYYEIRKQHLNKTIRGLRLENKFYSTVREIDPLKLKPSGNGNWLRLLSYRTWDEVVNTVTGEITVTLRKCPKDLRSDTSSNEKAFMLAKISACVVNIEDWS